MVNSVKQAVGINRFTVHAYPQSVKVVGPVYPPAALIGAPVHGLPLPAGLPLAAALPWPLPIPALPVVRLLLVPKIEKSTSRSLSEFKDTMLKERSFDLSGVGPNSKVSFNLTKSTANMHQQALLGPEFMVGDEAVVSTDSIKLSFNKSVLFNKSSQLKLPPDSMALHLEKNTSTLMASPAA